LVSNKTAAALSALPEDWPDIEYLTSTSYPGVPPDNDDYAGIYMVMVNTFSRGTVTIKSASMLDQPVVHVNFLTHPADKDVAIASIRRAREVFNHPAMSSIVVGPEAIPGNATVTDEQILQYIKASARTISHVSVTNKMGKEGDKLAVVNSKGKVFGVKRLRVVDVSAIPFLPPGHPMATVYALAEKVSEDILKEAGST
jgi:choline dehydrogenase